MKETKQKNSLRLDKYLGNRKVEEYKCYEIKKQSCLIWMGL